MLEPILAAEKAKAERRGRGGEEAEDAEEGSLSVLRAQLLGVLCVPLWCFYPASAASLFCATWRREMPSMRA